MNRASGATLGIEFAGYTDQGPRPYQEDAWLALRADDEVVLAVADGMGGHRNGREASALVIRTVTATPGAARDRVIAAHHAVRGLSRPREEAGPGSTATVVRIRLGVGVLDLGHLGDSRASVVRSGTLRRITVDHTIAGIALQRKAFTPEEYAMARRGSPILQYAGVPYDDKDIEFAGGKTRLLDGDVVVLTTDGVHEYLDDARFLEILTGPGSAADLARAVVEAAVASPTRDNCTCVVGIVTEAE